MTLADWNIPVKDFACKGHSAKCEVSKLAKWPYDKILVAFAQSIAWEKRIQSVFKELMNPSLIIMIHLRKSLNNIMA